MTNDKRFCHCLRENDFCSVRIVYRSHYKNINSPNGLLTLLDSKIYVKSVLGLLWKNFFRRKVSQIWSLFHHCVDLTLKQSLFITVTEKIKLFQAHNNHIHIFDQNCTHYLYAVGTPVSSLGTRVDKCGWSRTYTAWCHVDLKRWNSDQSKILKICFSAICQYENSYQAPTTGYLIGWFLEIGIFFLRLMNLKKEPQNSLSIQTLNMMKKQWNLQIEIGKW